MSFILFDLFIYWITSSKFAFILFFRQVMNVFNIELLLYINHFYPWHWFINCYIYTFIFMRLYWYLYVYNCYIYTFVVSTQFLANVSAVALTILCIKKKILFLILCISIIFAYNSVVLIFLRSSLLFTVLISSFTFSYFLYLNL